MKFLTHIPNWLKNKYLLTGGFFVVWMLFFDDKDIISGFERRSRLNELQRSDRHLVEIITDSYKNRDLLNNNAQSIEKYARENYKMKKDNEDLFILNPAPEDK
jgi:cell division protein DivIC